ncbi:MaoC family dehydratase [Caenimonas sp. S4]|nr:MaoC family dehydratase [Caenimonas soli]
MRFTSPSAHVSEADVVRFAKEFDPQPFHADPQAAKNSFFGRLVASGWHTGAVTMRLLATGGLPLAGGIIGASGQLQWPAPLRPDSDVHVETEVLDVKPSRSKSDRGLITTRSQTIDGEGTVVQVVEMKVLVWSKSQAK